MIPIRRYLSSDYDALKQILQEAGMFDDTWDTESNFASIQQSNPEAIQIAEVDQEVVGHVIIDQHRKETSFFYRLAVKEKHRGSGVRSALLKKAEEVARSAGAKEVVAYVDAENTLVQHFYSMKGYTTSGKKFVCMYKSVDKALA